MHQGPLYKGSKLQKVTFLISPCELEKLFASLEDLGPLCFFHVGALLNSEEADTQIDSFISAFKALYSGLQDGKNAQIKKASSHLNRSLSIDQAACVYTQAPSGRYLAKLTEPGVHVRIAKVAFSPELKKLHLNALGEEAFTFGLEASYPQLVQKTGQSVENALIEPFKNGALFKALRRELRALSRPVKFMLEDKTLFSELRVSKNAHWILDKMHEKWPKLMPQIGTS